MKKTMIFIISILVVLFTITWAFMHQATFGKAPSGERLERIQKSPQYKNGAFANESNTPNFGPGYNFFKILKMYFGKGKTEPADTILTIKSDIKNSLGKEPFIVWFGHSSYFIHIDGKNILVDPVIAGNASPVTFFGKPYSMSNPCVLEDLPEIDYLIITHDHYDHLDYETITRIKEKTKYFYTSLGVGAHLEHWGVSPEKIKELDWWENLSMGDSLNLTATPARHFSGRGFKRNQTLWSSFVLKSSQHNIYLGGDSGYDEHFKKIGDKFGPFDLALLECGQYNLAWPYIHMQPEEVVKASQDLKAEVLMPVHWSKFTLALHAWNEPVTNVMKEAEIKNVKVTTPMIGEKLVLGKDYPKVAWWK